MTDALHTRGLALLAGLVLGTAPTAATAQTTAGLWVISALSRGRVGMATATAGTKVLFASGADLVNNTNALGLNKRLDIYDAATNAWTADTLPIPRPLEQLVAGGAGTKIMFASGTKYGGSDAEGPYLKQ